jgi:hypothetical protein
MRALSTKHLRSIRAPKIRSSAMRSGLSRRGIFGQNGSWTQDQRKRFSK